MSATVHSAIVWWSDTVPDRVALSVDGDRLTYRGLNAWMNRVATRFRGLGLERGDRVAIFGANSLHWAATSLSAIKSGATTVPLNSRASDYEIEAVITDSTPRIVVVDDEVGPRFEALLSKRCTVIRMAEIRALRTGEDVAFEGADNELAPIAIAYTSGSTSAPKGVIFTHKSVLNYCFESMLSDPAYRPGHKLMLFAPLFAGAGTVNMLLTVCGGMTAFMTPQFEPEAALKTVVEEKVQTFSGVPVFLERVAQCEGFAAADLSSLKRVIVGGARVSSQLLEAWRAKGVVIRQLYGLTEGGGTTSVMDRRTAHLFPEKCGRGGPFTRHRIVDPDGADLPPNTQGEILVRGPGVMAGYWNKPEATAATVVNGWIHTGDLGVADEFGQITIVDRLKDIIISGGLNIASIDVENAINGVDGVLEVAVIAAPDEKFGETPMAVVYAKPGSGVTTASIVAQCKQKLADYKQPRYVVLADEPLPRLANGKMSKPAIREKYQDLAKTLDRVR